MARREGHSREAKNGLTQVVIYDTTDSDDDHLLRDDRGQPITWEKEAELLRKKASVLQQTTFGCISKSERQRCFVAVCTL
jgi:hypothetical protein